ncbi:MAG TPA: acyl-CoA dehydrogenase family protein [Candidatus Udaeobacter sp.]|nr:acyl-CoA dehydrogenase family protein [Candidatus Udaeobacter sp.]
MDMIDRSLSEEQRLMRRSCRAFVNDFVIPFIRANWKREWLMEPEQRLPREILEAADRIGIRTLAVPEEFGGVQLDPATEVQTFGRDRTRRFGTRRQAGAELEGFGIPAQPRAASSAGALVSAPG